MSQPLYLRCTSCRTVWPITDLPVRVSDLLDQLGALMSCPACGSDKADVPRQRFGELLEADDRARVRMPPPN